MFLPTVRSRTLSVLSLACLLGALAARPSAQVELKIDSATDGSTVLLQLGFDLGETGAVVLTPAAGTSVSVKELRVYVDKHPTLPGAPTLDGIFKVWNNATKVGGVLAPGAPVYTSPLLSFTPGGLSSWNVADQGLVMSGPFVVGVQLVSSGQPGSLTNPTLVTDNDGCQSGLNWAQLVNNSWVNTCAIGFSGDLVIRSLVQPLATGSFTSLGNGLAGNFAPTLTGSGSLAAGAGFSLAFAGLPPFTNGVLFIGVSLLNAPFKGGVLVPQPSLQLTLPTLSGSLTLSQPMPAGVPSNSSIYLHFWAPDAGAPVGVCATNALKLTTP